MSAVVIIRRVGNQLQTRPADRPFTAHEEAYLYNSLRFDRINFSGMYGAAAANGPGRPVSVPVPLVHKMGEYLYTTVGMYNRLSQALRALGLQLRFVDDTPTPVRPQAYESDWTPVYRKLRPYDPANAGAPGYFRPKQEDILRAMCGSVGGVVDVAPAVGKSMIIALFCLLHAQAKTHVVVRGRDVMQRLYGELLSHFPRVGRVGDGYFGFGDIATVISADSLHLSDGDADFVLCDEFHQLLCSGYAEQLIRLYPMARRFGFSGTATGRADNGDIMGEVLFGPTIAKIGYAEAVELGLVVPMRVFWLHNKIGTVTQGSKVVRDEHAIWRNMARNQLIADAVNKIPQDRQVLLLVDKVDHAVRLGSLLPGVPLIYGSMDEKAAEQYKRRKLLPPDYTPLTRKDRNRYREQFEQRQLMRAIATDVWNTGVDFKSLDVVVRCDVRRGNIQALQGAARASRLYDGKAYGVVIDVEDTFDRGYESISKTKRQLYRSYGWTQTSWTDTCLSGETANV